MRLFVLLLGIISIPFSNAANLELMLDPGREAQKEHYQRLSGLAKEQGFSTLRQQVQDSIADIIWVNQYSELGLADMLGGLPAEDFLPSSLYVLDIEVMTSYQAMRLSPWVPHIINRMRKLSNFRLVVYSQEVLQVLVEEGVPRNKIWQLPHPGYLAFRKVENANSEAKRLIDWMQTPSESPHKATRSLLFFGGLSGDELKSFTEALDQLPESVAQDTEFRILYAPHPNYSRDNARLKELSRLKGDRFQVQILPAEFRASQFVGSADGYVSFASTSTELLRRIGLPVYANHFDGLKSLDIEKFYQESLPLETSAFSKFILRVQNASHRPMFSNRERITGVRAAVESVYESLFAQLSRYYKDLIAAGVDTDTQLNLRQVDRALVELERQFESSLQPRKALPLCRESVRK